MTAPILLRSLTIVFTAGGLLLGTAAAAAPGRPTAAALEPPSAGAPAWLLEHSAAAITRTAALGLARTPVVTRRDYRIAADLLEIAHELAPRDQDILRRLIEAASSAGDDVRVLELTRRLVQLAPDDTVAQLRLISANILQLQDADARLAAYEGFLGPRGRSFDASIRSRLALDAALLHRERGDLRSFAQRLATAVELDITNKEAASLALAFYTERLGAGNRPGRVELLLTLLRADPLDPDTHLELARELAAGGAREQSARFYATAQVLRERLEIPAGPELIAENQMASWLVLGPEGLLEDVRTAIERQRRQVASQREAALVRGVPAAEAPDPESIVMHLSPASVMVAAAAALRDDGLVDWASGEFERAAAATAMAVDREAAAGNTGSAAGVIRALAAELLWMRLLAGRKLEAAGEQLQHISQESHVRPEALARMEGWYLLRRGMVEEAEERLRPLAESDPVALLGLALSAESQGDTDAAVAWYAQIARREAGTLVAAYAHTRVLALTGEAPQRSDEARRLETMAAAAAPAFIDRMAADPRSFMTIAAEPVPATADEWGRVGARVRLRNVSSMPLAVGPLAPINSRLLLTPTVEFGMDRAMGVATMEVASADRRLRLMPQESLDVTVRSDLGSLAGVLDQLADRTVRLRWRVLQAFEATPDGFYYAGPLGLSTETSVQLRPPVAMAGASGGALLEAIESGDPERIRAAIAGLSWRWPAEPERRQLTREELARIGAALAIQYPRLSAPMRMLLLTTLPPGSVISALTPLDAAAREETDPAVLAIALATRIRNPADPLLAAAAESADGRLSRLAGLLRERLLDPPPPAPQPAGGPRERGR